MSIAFVPPPDDGDDDLSSVLSHPLPEEVLAHLDEASAQVVREAWPAGKLLRPRWRPGMVVLIAKSACLDTMDLAPAALVRLTLEMMPGTPPAVLQIMQKLPDALVVVISVHGRMSQLVPIGWAGQQRSREEVMEVMERAETGAGT